MTAEEIAQLDAGNLCYVASQCLFSTLPNMRSSAAILSALSPGQQMLLATDLIETQVSNGGFHQCYFNYGDEFIPFAIDGFRLIGATACADIVQASWTAYRQAKPQYDAIHEAVNAQQSWQAFADSYAATKLSHYDTPFYQTRRNEDWEALQANYIRQHVQAEFPFLLTPQADTILEEWRAWEASADNPFNNPVEQP